MFKSLMTFIVFSIITLFSVDSFAAFSATKQREAPLGGLKVLIYEADFASVTSGTIVTGLNKILFAEFTNEVSDDHGIINKNSATASTTEDDPGQVHISSVTSSDTGVVLIIGR